MTKTTTRVTCEPGVYGDDVIHIQIGDAEPVQLLSSGATDEENRAMWYDALSPHFPTMRLEGYAIVYEDADADGIAAILEEVDPPFPIFKGRKPDPCFDWNDKEGKRRTCGELDAFLSGIAAEHPRVEYVRSQGLSNDLSPDDLLPDTERIAVECRLHWHDCNPLVRIYALNRAGEAVQYLWGIVFETRSRKEFETAHVVASELTGWLELRNY